uniref:FTH domain-containing protein n=1 Tax=Caenorhabditis tropicalis TaxID=1561998 RepID=A0A1I7TI96_9PELO
MNVSPTTPRSLLDLTSDELDIIMGYVGYKEIQVLRKVCSPLRDYIDQSPMDSKFDNVRVEELRSEKIQVWLYYKDKYLIIGYQKHPEGCFIEFKSYTEAGLLVNRSKLLKDVDYATTAGNDLGLILKHQKSTLNSLFFEFIEIPEERLTIECLQFPAGRLLTSLGTHLQSREFFLPVKSFYFWGNKEELLMKFLPYLKPITLESITIHNPLPDDAYLRLKKVFNLDQWKMAKKF